MIRIADIIEDKDLAEIINRQIAKAKSGDLRAAKFIVELIMIERDWETRHGAVKSSCNLKLMAYQGEEENGEKFLREFDNGSEV